MDLETYRQNRRSLEAQTPTYRHKCQRCRQPDFSCYCAWIKPFDPKIDFIILTHPIEVKRRRITTGRMAHLSLVGSRLIMGHDYSHDDVVNQLLSDSNRTCVMLYPGHQSLNLSTASQDQLRLAPVGKRLAVFVIDGTWATARKTVNLSRNLKALPRVAFSPDRPSGFRVRQQPRAECLSTIEAIYHTLELIGDQHGFSTATRTHESLLHAFEKMVARQIDLAHMKRP